MTSAELSVPGYQHDLCRYLYSLQQANLHCNVAIATRDRHDVHAHSLVLIASGSPMLHQLLQGGPETNFYIITNFEYENSEIVQTMVKSLYTGKIEATADNIKSLKALYQYLQLEKFVEVCDKISEKLPEVKVQVDEETYASDKIPSAQSVLDVQHTQQKWHLPYRKGSVDKYVLKKSMDENSEEKEKSCAIVQQGKSHSNGRGSGNDNTDNMDNVPNECDESTVDNIEDVPDEIIADNTDNEEMNVDCKIPTTEKELDKQHVLRGEIPSYHRRSVYMHDDAEDALNGSSDENTDGGLSNSQNFREDVDAADIIIKSEFANDYMAHTSELKEDSENYDKGEDLNRGEGYEDRVRVAKIEAEDEFSIEMENEGGLRGQEEQNLQVDKNGDEEEISIKSRKFADDRKANKKVQSRKRAVKRESACKMQIKLKSKIVPNQKYLCFICGKEFLHMGGYHRHLMNHNTTQLSKKHLCFVCGKEFLSMSGYRRHLIIHNTDTHDKIFQCSICEKKFVDRHHYEGHINKHYGTEPYTCSKCNATFSYKVSLNRHTKQCKGMKEPPELSQICSFCGKIFQSKDSLADHIKGKHDEEQSFDCEICGKGFKWRSSRSKHMKAQHQHNQ